MKTIERGERREEREEREEREREREKTLTTTPYSFHMKRK
jgi:hypothetical protein